MPIHGLTTVDDDGRLPIIGTLRKGEPKPERGVGKELDHWRFDTDDEDALAAFLGYYGAEPKTVQVMLPYDEIEANWDGFMEEWKASGLIRRCTGVQIVRWQQENGSYSTQPQQCLRMCGKACDCRPKARLLVILPILKRLSLIQVQTGSQYDIAEISANLQFLKKNFLTLRSIPFALSRFEKEISTPDGKGGRRRVKKWLMRIEPDPAWTATQLNRMWTGALTAAPPKLALPPPADEPVMAMVDDDDSDDSHQVEAVAETAPSRVEASYDPQSRAEPPPTPLLDAQGKTIEDIPANRKKLADSIRARWKEERELINQLWPAVEGASAPEREAFLKAQNDEVGSLTLGKMDVRELAATGKGIAARIGSLKQRATLMGETVQEMAA